MFWKSPFTRMDPLAWSLLCAALIHIIEEFVWPGGFKAWYRVYLPGIAASVTDRFLIGINGVLLGFSALVALAVQAPHGNGVAAWLSLAALLFCNGFFHALGTVQTRRYSPGVISGMLLYVPLAVYGFTHYVRSGRASVPTALFAVLIGGSYHFVSYMNHLRRARIVKTRGIAARTSPIGTRE